jgi:putative membrane protein
MDLIGWLTPWEFSPTFVLVFVVAAGLFLRGSRVHRVTVTRQILFWLGMALLYLSLHTRVDYYAERMFFIHRLQHLVLHHLGPLLIMGAFPGQVMRAGLPMAWRRHLRDFRHTVAGRALVGVLTNKYLIPSAFLFLVLVWLVPSIQFYSMLDWRLYRLMNWSVTISGILYWNLVLDRRPSPPAAMSPGGRVFSPVLTMTPQMIVGAFLTFSTHDIYPIFDLCGRAIPGITAQTDQALGGLIMWIPAGMVEVSGLMFALATVMRLSGKNRLPNKRERALARQRALAASAH